MKFFVHTYGCQMNVRDSEAVEALMIAAGHERARSEEDAEIVIVNSCTVRQKAEEKAVGKAGNLIAAKKITGLMGCAVKRMGEDVFKRLPKLDFAVGPRCFGLIPHIVDRITAGGERHVIETGADEVPDGIGAHPDSSKSGASPFQAYVTVLLGCDNRCSYCIVPDVRGHEYSRPANEVIAEVKSLVENGVKEVCLLGQSVLRYGVRNPAWRDGDPNPGGFKEAFPRLLHALNGIPGLERIRFTSAHPKGCTDELVRVYRECPKVCRHLHLPVQSGSDRILSGMGRRYTRDEYLSAVSKLRTLDPGFAVTTDVIVGYPGETDEDFEMTRSLMEEAGFDNSFIFKYSPRPGTRSALLPDDVPVAEKERRDQVLLADQEKRGARRNGLLVGSVRRVLAEGPSKRNPARWSGRDGGNRIVVWDVKEGVVERQGSLVDIKITEAHPQTLIGERI
ncbi:MAG: tRNA (N6-isopentenyl adenosine(37)-C2)-methylthiotransferase MiaB [Kiritimatiellae bacterium]|nr:tRNA (N6-isopentenyl adenosine(37)-C2)-methylthiotransferase MiaB [Kiritimatiellia bacterium]